MTVIVIATEVVIGGNGQPALTTGNYPDGLLIRNRGKIYGYGGNGKNGAPTWPGPSTGGTVGGDAIVLNCDTKIDNGNGGQIYGGGGGGSGSG